MGFCENAGKVERVSGRIGSFTIARSHLNIASSKPDCTKHGHHARPPRNHSLHKGKQVLAILRKLPAPGNPRTWSITGHYRYTVWNPACQALHQSIMLRVTCLPVRWTKSSNQCLPRRMVVTICILNISNNNINRRNISHLPIPIQRVQVRSYLGLSAALALYISIPMQTCTRSH